MSTPDARITDRLPLAFMAVITATPVITAQFPRFLAFWPIVIGLIFGAWVLFIRREKLIFPKAYLIAAGAISILCLSSVLWSIAPESAIKAAVKVSAILLGGGLFISLCATLDADRVKPYAWFFPVAVALAAAMCAIDLSTDMALYRLFHGKAAEGFVNSSVINRSALSTVFFFFIALLFMRNMDKKRMFLLAAIMGTPILWMLSLSQSQTGQLIFVTGLILTILFPARHKASYIALGIAVVAAVLLTPLIVPILFDIVIAHAQDNHWIREAYAGHRVEIWQFVMKYAMGSPLYGFGIEATRYVPAFEHTHIYQIKPTVLHPHNFAVQLWMDFGLTGALLGVLILKRTVTSLYHIENIPMRRLTTALFILLLLSAAITYGLWQSWWLGEIIFIFGLCLFLSKRYHRMTQSEQNAVLNKTPL